MKKFKGVTNELARQSLEEAKIKAPDGVFTSSMQETITLGILAVKFASNSVSYVKEDGGNALAAIDHFQDAVSQIMDWRAKC